MTAPRLPAPQKPAQAKPKRAAPVPGVEKGDLVYVKHPARGPIAVKVLAHGQDGLTGECDMRARHQVPWDAVLGHKSRMLHQYTVVDQGADGAILSDAKGKRRFLAGEVPQPAEEATKQPTKPPTDDPLLGGMDRLKKAEMLPDNARIVFLKALDPSAIRFRPQVGHTVEFRSDAQTDKGPCSGRVTAVSEDGSTATIVHSDPDHPGETFKCDDVDVQTHLAPFGHWILKGGQIANRVGLMLKDVTDKAGHRTKRWVRTAVDAPKARPEGAQGDAGQPGQAKPAMKHGDMVQFRHGDVTGQGKITASGADGVTLQAPDGVEHKVRHEHLEGPVGADGQVARGEGSEAKGEGAPAEGLKPGGDAGGGGDGPVPPDKFCAAAIYTKFDDPHATPETVLKSFPPDTADKIAEKSKLVQEGTQTVDLYKKDGEYTPEREAKHREIIDKFLSKERIAAAAPPAGQAPTFTILGGRGGSGKSWFEHKVYDPEKAIVLDADAIKQMLPEYKGWNAALLHEESGDLFDHITELAREKGLNIVHDATMKTAKKAVALAQSFKDGGYRTEAHYMFLPRQEAAKRAVSRFLGETGRLVPPEVVLGNTGNEQSFDQVKGLVDQWSFRDNNVAKGQEPKLISESKADGSDAGAVGRHGLPAAGSEDRDQVSSGMDGRKPGGGGGGAEGGRDIPRGHYAAEKSLGLDGGRVAIFLKAHVSGYTRSDGVFVRPHEDSRPVSGEEGNGRGPASPPGGAQQSKSDPSVSSDGSAVSLSTSTGKLRSYTDVSDFLTARGVPFRVEHSTSISEAHGPSASSYFHVDGPSGKVKIRVSNHDYLPADVDLRYGMEAADAERHIAGALALPMSPAAREAQQKADAAVASWKAAQAAAAAERAKTAGNDKLLTDAGLGHLTGKARRRALEKLKAETK